MSAESSNENGLAPVGSGRVIANRYRLRARLGRGGMGEVYEAVHLEIPKRFALKLLRSDYAQDAQMRVRFQREAQAAAALTSEHIVQVFDFGHAEDGSPYLVMELLEGGDMRRALRERPFSTGEAVEIVRQACAGAQVAHEQSIVHRDLKPENLFLARRGRHETVKVLDFGIAKLWTGEASTAAGKLLGTPGYMSPEQARGSREVDPRTDVYALGVILYEALSGHLPHPGEDPHEIIAHLLFEDADPITRWNAQLPSALVQVVHKALARQPADRFQSAAALRSALASFAGARDALVHELVEGALETAPAQDSECFAAPAAQVAPKQAPSSTEGGPRRSGARLIVACAAALAALSWFAAPDQGRKAAEAANRRSTQVEPPAAAPAPAARVPTSAVPPAASPPTQAVVAAPQASAARAAGPTTGARRPNRTRSGGAATVSEAAKESANDPTRAAYAPPEGPSITPSAASTLEVRRGTQTILFMRENPLRQ